MKTIQEVLADHQQWVSGSCGLEDECNCGHQLGGESIARHQADMLAEWQAQVVRDVSERVGKRYATLHQMLRDELQAQAFDNGFTACAHEHMKQREDPTHPITRINPHKTEDESFAQRLSRKSAESIEKQWRHEQGQLDKDYLSLIDEME